jgi:hypothetical protein
MMAPPLITQERASKSTNCTYEYSTRWVEEQHKVVKDSLCADPNVCVDQRVVTSPELTAACLGDGRADGSEYFGLAKRAVQGKEVVAVLMITMKPFPISQDCLCVRSMYASAAVPRAPCLVCSNRIWSAFLSILCRSTPICFSA